MTLDTAKEVPPVVEKYFKEKLEPMIDEDYAKEGIVLNVLAPEVVAEMRERSMKVHDLYINMGPEFKATYDYYKGLIDKYGDTPPTK